jgi:metal-responsive CopG/Arc/MetJ family transcriptional regulator
VSQGTQRRTVRIDDGLWGEAQEVAIENSDNLSEVIRDALRLYIETSKA